MTQDRKTPNKLWLDLALAAVLLLVPFLFIRFAPDRQDLAVRIVGILSGVAVMYYANKAPKHLKPLASLQNPAQHQSLTRFTSWLLVLGGIGYMLAWIFAPIRYAAPVSVALLGTAMVVVLVRHVWARRAS